MARGQQLSLTDWDASHPCFSAKTPPRQLVLPKVNFFDFSILSFFEKNQVSDKKVIKLNNRVSSFLKGENWLKLIYVAIDGMGDLPIKSLGNKTPLEAAETPNMDALARNGKTGLMYSVKKGVAPESDVAVISLLGYDPFKYSTGRGVIEVGWRRLRNEGW